MITRRLFCTAAATGTALAVPLGQARAADPDQAAAFIEKMLKDLLVVVNAPGGIDAKRAALSRIVDERVDVEGVARFCLGRFWRTATPQQQTEYLSLFRKVLSNNVTGKVGDYQGVSFTMGKPTKREDDIAVATVVTRPGNAPNKVDWLVTASGTPKVIDVIAEGTSLRLTQRSDYAAYLSRNGNNVQALIDALRQQASAAPNG